MTRIIGLVISFFIALQGFAQTADLNQYSFVIVPNQFGFQKGLDQYQLNSMTKFYLDKNGFNSFLTSDSPNVDRCEGLYADVEELKTLFGTKLQVVLKDCNKKEIYRGPEGKSKFKEHDKSYQDALRKAFDGLAILKVNQKNMVVLVETSFSNEQKENEMLSNNKGREQSESTHTNKALNLPSENYSNYLADGESFVLRRTGEGYSLYKESTLEEDDLILVGKIIIFDKLLKFMDSSGKVNDAVFDEAGTLKVGTGISSIVYNKIEN